MWWRWSGTTADRARRLFAVAVLSACAAGLAACGGAVRAPVGERHAMPPQPAKRSGVHRVRRGESLFSIAWQYGLDYRALARWNGIRPPYVIHPGQRLRLYPPSSAAADASGRSRAKPGTSTSRRPAAPDRIGKRSEAAASTAGAPDRRREETRTAASAGPLRWVWPARGPILRRFDPRRPGKKGIRIGGRPGDPVRAAESGRVVYSGSGLVGYGRLIIIKHNNRYLSAYGHNRELLVKEGDFVRRGQVIARLGSSGTNRPQLHFEIRRNGRPVDPLRYLPRRR